MSAPAAAIEPLLSDDGDITAKFEAVLQQVFRRYASSLPSDSSPSPSAPPAPLDIFSNAFTLSREDLNRFASDTNGQPMTDETYEEISTFLDMVEGRLTFKGFFQLYQLQTENDEEETHNDLTAWGFTPDLELVETRRVEVDEGVRPALESLTGLGLGGEKKDKEVEA